MQLRIRHKINYRFEQPARNVTRILRLTPRSHEGQHVIGWQLDVDIDCVLKLGEDGFGNITHTFTAKGPCAALEITVAGEIDNFDAAGVVRGSAERLPIEIYLRETPLTAADPPLRDFCREIATGPDSDLGKLHALMGRVHATVAFDEKLADAATCGGALAARKGNGRDIAHVFTSCARVLGLPARVISGYYLCDDKQRGICHAWAEVFIQGLGWTGFDAAHDICPQEQYVRLATGLDALAAARIRGVADETVSEALDMSAPYGLEWGQYHSRGGQSQSQGGGGQMQRQGGSGQRQD